MRVLRSLILLLLIFHLSMAEESNEGDVLKRMQKPVKVGVTVLFNSITKINNATNNFEASVDIHLNWVDPSLAFDPITLGTFRQELCEKQAEEKLTKIWNPHVIIDNLEGKPEKERQCLLIYADGTVELIQRVRSLFKASFNLATFPFDTQKLSIKLLSDKYNNNEIQFVQDQKELNYSGLREGLKLYGWNIVRIRYHQMDIRGLNGTFYPEFEARITIQRQPLIYSFDFAPLLLIVVVPTLVTLYVSAETSARLGYWSGAILALIALSFTLNLRHPALPAGSILSQIISIIFGYEFLMIILTLTILNPTIGKKVKNPYVIPEMINFLRWSVPICFTALILARVFLTKYV